MPTIVVVGATRGLGRSLVEQYAAKGNKVYGTARKNIVPTDTPSNVQWMTGVDMAEESVGSMVVNGYKEKVPIDVLVVTAGYFGQESLEEPKWDSEVQMYKTSAIGPVFLVSKLVQAGLLGKGSKVIMVSSESGSITLRHETEGGGNYGHHASKAALNMVVKLLSIDLKDREICVVSVHPGFMRTQMTKGVGFDKYWDSGGGKMRELAASRPIAEVSPAVTPDVAAKSLIDWIETCDISKTGEYWAPRGPA
jgi:NAD(P)-dependent dehydrogenase (short-subunit alcohol dehydrogenase family)